MSSIHELTRAAPLLLFASCSTEAVAGMPAQKAVVTDAMGGKAEVVQPNVHISKVRNI
jgi:hypothetical protein